jgi:hypothetical protein
MPPSPSYPSTFSQLVWVSFRGTIGTFVGVMGFLVGIAAWLFPTPGNIPLSIFVTTILVSVAIIITLVEAARIAHSHAANPLPRVRLSLLDERNDSAHIILILEPSPLLYHGLITSIFLIEQDHYERFIAHGVVQNVQDDGLIQVRMEALAEGFSELLGDLKAAKAQTLSHLRVKPHVQQGSFNEFHGGTL